MKYLLLILLTTQLLSNELVDMVKKHEGFSSTIYKDSGHLSIGYGTNLSYGITEAEAELLLIHRLSITHEKLKQFSWFNRLSYNRKLVIVSMGYQLGISGLLDFKHLIWRLERGYYKAAANAMVESLWFKQSGNRAKELVKLMKQG